MKQLVINCLCTLQPAVRLLLAYPNIDINTVDEWGASALHLLLATNHAASASIVSMLYQTGIRLKPPEPVQLDDKDMPIPAYVCPLGDWPPKDSVRSDSCVGF